MKSEVLKMLRSTDGYVSGQEICEKFGVSRTAVWKVIRQLQEEGYQVEAVRNRGYRITGGPDVITAEEIESLLNTRWAGRPVVYSDETDSTNLRAKRLGDDGAPEGTLVITEHQTAGRGRRGRVWESAGGGIYMSLLLRPDITPDQAPMLTLVMACSVAEGILECAPGTDVRIKWPNDIVADGKKLAGILTEMSTQIDYINHVTIGVGINVNMKKFPPEIEKTASSLYLETGKTLKRAPLAVSVLKCFEENYMRFTESGDMTGLMEKYSRFLINKGREVCISEKDMTYTALAEGINRKGELVVRKEDGTVASVCSGEVSVRGIYGYV